MNTNQFVVSFNHPKSGHQELLFECPIRAVQVARLVEARWGRPAKIESYGFVDDERAARLNRQRIEHATATLKAVVLKLAAG